MESWLAPMIGASHIIITYGSELKLPACHGNWRKHRCASRALLATSKTGLSSQSNIAEKIR